MFGKPKSMEQCKNYNSCATNIDKVVDLKIANNKHQNEQTNRIIH